MAIYTIYSSTVVRIKPEIFILLHEINAIRDLLYAHSH